MPWYAILLWVFLLGTVAFIFIKQQQGKKAYKDKDMSVDEGWFEKSQALYPEDETVYQYYMHPDKNFSNQGHVVVDRSDRTIYEEKVLYATVAQAYEEDFVNHLLNYTHHHKLGHASSISVGFGQQERHGSFTVQSSFPFDGTDVWEYIRSKGYGYEFHLHGLAYTIDLYKDGMLAGTLYSSNNGKNYYNADGPIKPKMGGAGYYVLECRNRDLDAMVLLALAFTKTDFNPQSLQG